MNVLNELRQQLKKKGVEVMEAEKTRSGHYRIRARRGQRTTETVTAGTSASSSGIHNTVGRILRGLRDGR